MSFQKKARIKEDGKYGSQSHAALMAAIAEKDAPQQTEPEEPAPSDPPQEEPVEPEKKVTIVCDSGTVNIRVDNDT